MKAAHSSPKIYEKTQKMGQWISEGTTPFQETVEKFVEHNIFPTAKKKKKKKRNE